jgi:hypothetical protein
VQRLLRFERCCIDFAITDKAVDLRMKMKLVKRDDGTALPGETPPNDLHWVHQLVHQAGEFAEAPRRRFPLWPDRQPALAKHAAEAAHVQQLIALNLLSEGVAFGRYGAAMSLQDKLKILSGQSCNVDADVDMHPSMIERARRDGAISAPSRGRPYRQALAHFARLSQQTLNSWLGVPAAPLKQT